MSKSVKAAGMDKELSGKGPFTIFAPSEIAFGKLATGKLEQLLKPENKDKLVSMLSHHVVEGINNFSDLKDNMRLVTTNGRELKVKIVNETVTVNGATIQGKDNIGSNGVVHSLDAIIEMK